MKMFEKWLVTPVDKEEGDFKSYLRLLESGAFIDRMNYGVAEDKRGFLLLDPVQQPGALYCGGMGSGKSVAMRFTLLTHMIANSANTFYILVDPLKGMTDYTMFFNYPKNVATALNDVAKLIPVFELVHQECMARKEEFSHYGAANIYEYDRIRQKKEPSFPGLTRIVVAIEEFHAVPVAENIKYHMNVDRPGSAAYMLKELLRVGRSYGITFLTATQRATADDFPSSLKPGITQLMAFRVNNPGDAGAINLPGAADIKSNQRGRCVYEGGFIQFPYVDDKTTGPKLLAKYYRPLETIMIRHEVAKYHEAFSGEGNAGLVKVKPLKSLLDNLNQFKVEDVATRFLEAFDFKVTTPPNSALAVNLIAERDNHRYAVLILQGRGMGGSSSGSEKSVVAFKDGARTLKCDRMIALSMDSAQVPGAVTSATRELGGYALDSEDLNRIAQVLDNQRSLERDGNFQEMYAKLALVRKDDTKLPGTTEDEDDAFADFAKFTSKLPAKPKAPEIKEEKPKALGVKEEIKVEPLPSPEPKEVPLVIPPTPEVKRPQASTGGGTSLLDLRERLRANLRKMPDNDE